MKSIIVSLVVVGLVSLGLTFLLKNRGASSSLSRVSNSKIQVTTSFYPLAFFTSEIGKNQVAVTNLTPAGAEPHDYEPSAQDIAQLETAELLIVNGAGFEPWLSKVMPDLKAKKIPVLAAAEDLVSLQIEADGETLSDPHVWLDPVLAKQEVAKIAQALMEVDPEHRVEYEANTQQLQAKLDALDQEFRVGLAVCRQKNIVTSHQAFGYLASRYGLKQVAITGLASDLEPTPAELAKIVRFAKDTDVKYIFFETLVSPRLADTIAQEIGAQTLVFDPLEGLTAEDQAAGLDYFTVQRDNLSHLKTALECQ
jgi:zinc transport system substrate-binding protein